MPILKLSNVLFNTYTHSTFAVPNYNLKNHFQSCASNLSTFGRKTIAIHNMPVSVKGPGGCIGETGKKEAIALWNTLRYEKEPIPVISA